MPALLRSSLCAALVIVMTLAVFADRTLARSGPPDSPRRSAALAVASPTPTATPSPSPTASATPAASAPVPAPGPASGPAHPAAGPLPTVAGASDGVTLAVPVQHQAYNLSCEESSLSMVMAFYGRSVSDQDVLGAVGVDRAHYWTGPGGGDPFQSFVGDPNGSEVRNTGYGVYWPPIRNAATHFGAAVGQAGQGVAPGTVYGAVAAGFPVLVWVTYDLAPHARSDYQAYDGETIPYAGPEEHAMVVSGVSATEVRLNDPDRGQYWITRSHFETAYAVYGQMAIIFSGRTQPAPTPTPTPIVTPRPTSTPTPTPTPRPTPTPTPAASTAWHKVDSVH